MIIKIMNFKSNTLIIDEEDGAGYVRNCNYNIARMNTFEYMYCKIFIWKEISNNVKDSFCEMVNNLKEFFFHFIDLITFPIQLIFIFPIICNRKINKVKREVFEDMCLNCSNYKTEKCKECILIDGTPNKYNKIESEE